MLCLRLARRLRPRLLRALRHSPTRAVHEESAPFSTPGRFVARLGRVRYVCLLTCMFIGGGGRVIGRGLERSSGGGVRQRAVTRHISPTVKTHALTHQLDVRALQGTRYFHFHRHRHQCHHRHRHRTQRLSALCAICVLRVTRCYYTMLLRALHAYTPTLHTTQALLRTTTTTADEKNTTHPHPHPPRSTVSVSIHYLHLHPLHLHLMPSRISTQKYYYYVNQYIINCARPHPHPHCHCLLSLFIFIVFT